MMNKLRNPLVAFFILVVCSCCNDNEGGDPEPLPVINVPQDVKDYMVFKQGTYWVYKDSTSEIEDSVFVAELIDKYDTIIQTTGGIKSGIYEWFETHTHSALDGYDYYYKYNIDQQYTNPYYLIAVLREKLEPGDYVGQTYCYLYPFTIGYTATWSTSPTTVVGYAAQYSLNANSFIKVVKVHEAVNVSQDDQSTNFYFAKNVGLIRKELLDSNQAWNLTRYNIVQ